MGNAVEIMGFTKSFGKFVAVEDLNLSIREGEIFGLLGPNGSGKSTTLLTIATVYKPTRGDIYVLGHSVTREDYIVRKLVSIAFQDPKAMWIDKPIELLTWHARVVGYSSSEAEKVVKEVLELLGLWEHRNKYFYQLSGGTRKKIELAKVLIQKTPVMIFDEPTAQVDVLSKHALWDVIRSLKKEGRTVIIATNDMFEAEKVCDRVGIIFKGKLRAIGTIGELKDLIPSGDVIEIHVKDRVINERVVENLEEFGLVKISEGVIKVYVNKSEEKVIDIIDMFRKHNITIDKLMIKEPSLDDVFTYITGAKLRED